MAKGIILVFIMLTIILHAGLEVAAFPPVCCLDHPRPNCDNTLCNIACHSSCKGGGFCKGSDICHCRCD
ncbi:hypothetical protein HN51_022538 [Arachis hypogaea]